MVTAPGAPSLLLALALRPLAAPPSEEDEAVRRLYVVVLLLPRAPLLKPGAAFRRRRDDPIRMEDGASPAAEARAAEARR